MVQKKLATGVGGIFIFSSSHLLLCVAVDKPGCEEGEDARDPSTKRRNIEALWRAAMDELTTDNMARSSIAGDRHQKQR